MIDGKSVLAIIPARGGSKGVERKNIREVSGKPLIAWTIEEAKKSKHIDRLILSSEDSEIIMVAKSLGCEAPFVRPAELAQDETPGIDPVLHAMSKFPNYEIVVLLQPTTPLRSILDIDGCIEHCLAKNANACVSVTQVEENPYWMYTLSDDGEMHRLIQTDKIFNRRQDLPIVYIPNGAVYVAYRDWLLLHRTFLTEQTFGFVMPQERSLDIDTEQDIQLMHIMHQKVRNAIN